MASSSKISICDLPNELLSIVCENLHPRRTCFESRVSGATCDLKALRLVSKRFKDIAAQWIFKVIMLRPHPDFWERLSAIADRPYLAKYVACLEVVTTEHLDNMRRRQDMARTCYTPECRNCDGLVKARFDIGSTLAKVSEQTMCSSGVDEYGSRLKQRYRYWEDGATQIKQMLEGFQNPLVDSSKRFDFGKLVNLRSIVTMENRDLIMIDPRDGVYGQCKCENIYLGLRRKIEWIGGYLRVWHEIHTRNLELAIQTMIQSGNPLSSLSFHRSAAMLRYAPTEARLLNLRTLTLGRPYKGRSESDFGPYAREHLMTQWLTDLPNLHTLKITQSLKVAGMVNIVRALGDQRYPNLKVLYLKHVVTTATDLRKFLMLHLAGLESLIIDTPVIFTPDWHVLQKEIATYSSDRCNLVLTDSFKPKVSRHRKSEKIQRWWDGFDRRLNPPMCIIW